MAFASITYTSVSGTTFALTNSNGDPIEYIRQADIYVYVNNVLKTLTTDYTFNTAGTAIVLNTAVTSATVTLQRITDIADRTVVYTAGSTLTSQDLNNADNQILYGLQEFKDYVAGGQGVTDGDKGDIIVGNNGASWSIDNGVITDSKFVAGTISNSSINASAAIAGSKIQTATTSNTGAVQLTDSISSTSTSTAATPNSVKTAYDLASTANTTASTASTTASAANTTANSAVVRAGDTMTGVLGIIAGTAAIPSLSFSSDTNTGIYSPGADTLAFTEGGVEALRIDSSGRVGIGTTNPGASLDVNGNIRLSAAAPNIEFNNGGAMVYGPAANTLAFATGGSPASPAERFRIGSSGQLGVGGANYGTSGQVLTSGGASAAPTWSSVSSSGITSGTAVASTSGVAIDFTGIPSTAKRITVMLSGVSTSGSSILQIQLGTSSGIENTGYLAVIWMANTANQSTSTGFYTSTVSALSYALSGSVAFTLLNGNNWVAAGVIGRVAIPDSSLISGSKNLSGTLDRIRITTVNGTDTFDAGSINILYEG